MRAFITFLILVLLPSAGFAQDYAIEATQEAHIRQSIEVSWTAADETGNMIEIRPLEEGARRVAYSYLQTNPEYIEAPEQPGVYLLVFTHGGDVVASQPLSVVMAEATIAAPEAAGAGESIEVSWTGPISRSDFIAWAERGGDHIRGSSYGYVGNSPGGSRSLRAPADAGEYDVVYITGSTILARAPVTVGSISATVTAPATIHAGGNINVTFEGPENSGDLITFGDRDGDSRAGIGSYTYVGNATGNGVTLRVGETLGEFDVVYVSNGRVIGRSPIDIVEASVAIDGPGEVHARFIFNVAWEGAGNGGDMVFISDADGNRFDYSYIDPQSPTVELIAPENIGDYTLVYRTPGGAIMDTEPLSVTPAPNPPGELIVTQNRAALGAGDAVEIILDASGSMLQRIGGDRRIEIAKTTLTALVNETIPEGTGFALRVFGHREADSCRTDLEIPLGPLNAAEVTATIADVNAMNLARTPIGASIAHVRSDLAAATGQRVLVVLTDGEETCDGDAASEIAALRALGWDIRVNIVGFAIDDAELEQTFESWAAAGNGSYFSAVDAEGLADAMTRAVATRFEVINGDGEMVASGLTGGDPITLPTGDYRIVGGDAEVNATIISEEVTTVGLD
ncbi:VWA domain-containing protein [Hyphobacterium sp.]|uniref:vWA domain-containing protein n=1 Tax=Hyphobacterium sp. TaxID=2004662 RepID=UPI0037482AB3